MTHRDAPPKPAVPHRDAPPKPAVTHRDAPPKPAVTHRDAPPKPAVPRASAGSPLRPRGTGAGSQLLRPNRALRTAHRLPRCARADGAGAGSQVPGREPVRTKQRTGSYQAGTGSGIGQGSDGTDSGTGRRRPSLTVVVLVWRSLHALEAEPLTERAFVLDDNIFPHHFKRAECLEGPH